MSHHRMMRASLQENLSLGFPTRSNPKQPAQLHTLARKLIENLLVASLDMIFSNKRITKALISLCGCCSLFANPKDRFSGVQAHV